jgi:hypothetical protein
METIQGIVVLWLINTHECVCNLSTVIRELCAVNTVYYNQYGR